ncbi:MAG: 50S ribosomal protein L9 [Planctomycetota bacterium]|nr:50S ribosomal protein L9 [Planctomycetota bacterium]
MARNYELLLLETIENLGLVGDVVKVRPGFARNFLLPNAMAEAPTPEKIESLKAARATAEAHLSKQRAEREAVIARLAGITLTLVRACNDQGVLYGAVTQRDISDQLIIEGYGIDIRAVRLNNPIRRINTEQVTIQFGRDLVAEITVVVKPDRIIEMETPSQSQRSAEPSADDAQSEEPSDDALKGKSGKGKSDEGKSEEGKSEEGKSDRGTKSARKGREKSTKE